MLTQKQKELLDYITLTNKKRGICPSYEEMKNRLNYSQNLVFIE